MGRIRSPFQLGNLSLSHNVFYAPLAGCSDFPFRQMCARYRPGLLFCEMVKMDALVRNDPNTFHFLDYSEDMHPIGGQIVGSRPKIAGKAAKIIEELGFDVVELNCGCPVDKVTKDGSGSGMLRTPARIGEVIAEMVAAVKIPVTVKVRAGWDEDSIVAPDITRIAELAGAQAISVHGRSRQQGFRGSVDRAIIKACKEAANEILVIGNGDIFDADSALAMFDETGCDAILVARGTLGSPWIVEDILRAAQGEVAIERTEEDDRQALLEHFRLITAYRSERKALVEMRRVGCWYIKRTAGTREFRMAISHARSLEEARLLIENFSFGEGG